MIRPVLTELALFLAPFIVYAIFLWATQAGVLHPDAWTCLLYTSDAADE